MPETYLALLRGINVGGKNQILMKDLIEIFIEAGCVNVRTYIQSGNVLFQTPESFSSQHPNLITSLIEARFGYRIPIVIRTLEQIREVLATNPFLQNGAPLESLHVVFLKDLPTALHAQNLDPERSPPDVFELRGQEIFMLLPNGAADSKLTNAYFDSKLKTVSTGRNWRTVNKLYDLMQS